MSLHSKTNPDCYLIEERYSVCDGHWKCHCPPLHYNSHNQNVPLCFKGTPVYGDTTTYIKDVRCSDCLNLLEDLAIKDCMSSEEIYKNRGYDIFGNTVKKEPERQSSRFDDLELE